MKSTEPSESTSNSPASMYDTCVCVSTSCLCDINARFHVCMHVSAHDKWVHASFHAHIHASYTYACMHCNSAALTLSDKLTAQDRKTDSKLPNTRRA